jgi:hypothetical protein
LKAEARKRRLQELSKEIAIAEKKRKHLREGCPHSGGLFFAWSNVYCDICGQRLEVQATIYELK